MDDEGYYVDVLLPGFIEASSGVQFGAPCLKDTRLPTYVGLGWVWDTLDDRHGRRVEGLIREQIIALAAFDAGVEWQRSRKRRKRMDDEVKRLWERIAQEREAWEAGSIELADPRDAGVPTWP